MCCAWPQLSWLAVLARLLLNSAAGVLCHDDTCLNQVPCEIRKSALPLLCQHGSPLPARLSKAWGKWLTQQNVGIILFSCSALSCQKHTMKNSSHKRPRGLPCNWQTPTVWEHSDPVIERSLTLSCTSIYHHFNPIGSLFKSLHVLSSFSHFLLPQIFSFSLLLFFFFCCLLLNLLPSLIFFVLLT